MARLSNSQWIRQHFRTRKHLKPVTNTDLTGKTVMLIGANSGIGFEAVKHFAQMNPGRLIMGCRSQERGQAALDKLKKETGYEKAELWIIDLNSFASVKAFAERFEKEGGRLDILVENAGLWPTVNYEKTADGWTIILQSNVIAPAYHALLMIPHMLRTAQECSTTPRLVITASFTHYFTDLAKFVDEPSILDVLNSKKYYKKRGMEQKYYDSKLLDVFFTRALQNKLSKSGPSITVNCIDPGFCATGFRSDVSRLTAVILSKFESAMAYTTEQGSRQIIFGAIARTEDEESMKGAYIALDEVTEVSDFVLSKEGEKMQERLWDNLTEVLSKYDPTISEVVNTHIKQ